MGLIDKFKKPKQEEKAEEKPDGRHKLDKRQIDAGRMLGAASLKDNDLIQRWKELLRSKGINPTDRIIGIAQYDLNTFSDGKPMPRWPQNSGQLGAEPAHNEKVRGSSANRDVLSEAQELQLVSELVRMMKQQMMENLQEVRNLYIQMKQQMMRELQNTK